MNQDQSVVLTRIDLYNESGNKFGSAECERTENPLQVFVRLDAESFLKWLEVGTVVTTIAYARALYLRVYMTFKGAEEEVYRSISVSSSIEGPLSRTPVNRLHGEV